MKGLAGVIVITLLSGLMSAAADEFPSRTPREAEHMITARGFYGITDLRIDSDGTWRASAIKYDRRWLIDLDERGNLTSAPVSTQGDLAPERPNRAKANLRLFLIFR